MSSTNAERVLASVQMWGDAGTFPKIASTLKGAVPPRTLKRWLSQLVREGRLTRRGASIGTRYAVSYPPRGNGGAAVATGSNCRAVSASPAVADARNSDGLDGNARVAPDGSSVSYDRAILDAYWPNETHYLTEPMRTNLSRWSRGRGDPAGRAGPLDPPLGSSTVRPGLSVDQLGTLGVSKGRTSPSDSLTVGRDLRIPPSGTATSDSSVGRGLRTPPFVNAPNPAGNGDPVLQQPAQPTTAPAAVAALSPEWQRFTADLVVWSRDAQVALGFAARRHRRVMAPKVVAAVVARADVPSMAGELRRIWNHRAAVALVVAADPAPLLTLEMIAAVQSALTHPPAPAASAGASVATPAVAGVTPRRRPICRSEPLLLAGTAYHPTADVDLIEPCLRQIVLTAGAILDPAEASFFVLAHLLLLLPFAAENLSAAVLLANLPLLRAGLAPVSPASIPPADFRAAVLAWWELRRPDLLARLWTRIGCDAR